MFSLIHCFHPTIQAVYLNQALDAQAQTAIGQCICSLFLFKCTIFNMHTFYLHKIVNSEVCIARRTYYNDIEEGRIQFLYSLATFFSQCLLRPQMLTNIVIFVNQSRFYLAKSVSIFYIYSTRSGFRFVTFVRPLNNGCFQDN